MFLAAWVSIGAVVGLTSWLLARDDCRRQRERGACYADVQFVNHRSSKFCVFVLCMATMWFSAQTHSGIIVLAHSVLVLSGTWMSLVDIDTHTVPRRSQMIVWCVAATLFIVLSVAGDSVALDDVALGALMMWVAMRAIEGLSRGSVGPADAVFAGYLGMFVGATSVSLVPFALLAAFVSGGLAALVLMIVFRVGRHSHLPFAPFLFLGTLVSVLR